MRRSNQPPSRHLYDTAPHTTTTHDINVLALVKGTERYIFRYDNSHRTETLRALGRYASNLEFSFTWCDAAVLSQKIRQQSESR